ncbi:MAG TPA: metallophosphoesterase, partial [Roseiflexaceae bacterium]|nr:metallophosphoesterase [Roseiflexaceae bacterium]
MRFGESDFSRTASATSIPTTTPAPAPYNQYYVHQAVLTGLLPNINDQYKIFTNDADLTPGGSGRVRAALPSNTPFRFAALGDSGDGSQNQKDVAARLLQAQPDLVVHTGDLIYEEATYDGFETKYFQIYKDLLKNTWLAPSAGNHDITYNNGKSFTDVFVNPTNGSSDPVNRELYYSFDYGNAHFVVLDNFLSYTPGSEQYTWLDNDLRSTNQFWKFVIYHVPPYASRSDQTPRDDAKQVQYLVPLYEKYHVNVVLTGHWHYYERMKPLLGGQVTTLANGGVVYLITGGGGAGLAGVGTGTLNSRTDVKVQAYHLTMFEINDCRLQLYAVRKDNLSNGQLNTFDPYTIDRCGGTTPTPPTANFSASPTSGSAPLAVQFSDTSTGSPTSWQWDFDNNGSTDSTAQNPSFSFANAGTYSVKLTVTNAGGSNSTTKSGFITVTSGGGGGGGSTLTFAPSADAYVKSDSATSSFGTATSVRVKTASSSQLRSYFKFDVAGLTGAVT